MNKKVLLFLSQGFEEYEAAVSFEKNFCHLKNT